MTTMRIGALGITRAQLAAWADQCGLQLVPIPIVDDGNTISVDEAVLRAREDEQLRSLDGSSVVYFIQEDGLGFIKIGTSKHLKKRADEINRILPTNVTVLATTSGGHEVEWVIQQRFAYAGTKGEWFRPVPELLAYIAEIKARAA